MSLNQLRSQVRNYHPVTLDAYDRLAGEEDLFNLLHLRHDNRTLRENPVRLRAPVILGGVFTWADNVMATGAFEKIDWTVPVASRHAFDLVQKDDLDRPGTLLSMQQSAATWPVKMQRAKTDALLDIFHLNPVAYTQQPFFSNVHDKVGDNTGTFDNTVLLGFATPASPTLAEARAFMDAVAARFVLNMRLQSSVTDSAKFDGSFVVIVHNLSHFNVLNRLRREPQLVEGGALVPNPYHGFRLFLDHYNFLGDAANEFEVVYTGTPGILPCWYVQDSNPENDVWDGKEVPTGYVAPGMKESWGLKPAFPESCIRGVVT